MLSRRFALVLLPLVVLAAAVASGEVKTGPDWWRNYWAIWHRNNTWPEPFNDPDRASVCAMFQSEIIKGWEQQNLLGDPHFDPSSSKMSPAGLIKLRWILTQNPPAYRTPFVERAITDDITARRVAAAQLAAAELAPGVALNVEISDMRMMTTPSGYVTGVHDWFGKFMKTIPDPQIPAFQTSSGGGGGGGGSSGGSSSGGP
jgi:hypothetical protein